MNTSRPFAGLIAFLTAVSLLLAACGQAASPAANGQNTATILRLGYFANLTHAPALVGVAKGTFQQALGAGVTLEVITFNAGPALIEALFANEIDVAYSGPNPAINGFVRSNGDALRIIAGATSGGAFFVVRPEAGISTAADLAGKKFATPQLGNTQDVALRYYLRENDLETADKGGSVEIVPTQNADILTLFQQGAIDGAWVPEPWATRLIQEAGGEIFIDERDAWPEGRFVTTHLIASRAYLEANPDLVSRFLMAHVETIEFINANAEESKSLVNAEIERVTTKPLPRAVLDASYPTLEFTFDPLASTLFVSADHAFELGFLADTKPDLSQIYSLDLLNAVLQEKGLEAVAAS
ncbi:ABC transporter substrate-binding protein [Candidatus Gracilibacteria bacterium]|nr:ABC transporter substrate-binding protein [Candidatus Gracilibacteria bacterium]